MDCFKAWVHPERFQKQRWRNLLWYLRKRNQLNYTKWEHINFNQLLWTEFPLRFPGSWPPESKRYVHGKLHAINAFDPQGDSVYAETGEEICNYYSFPKKWLFDPKETGPFLRHKTLRGLSYQVLSRGI